MAKSITSNYFRVYCKNFRTISPTSLVYVIRCLHNIEKRFDTKFNAIKRTNKYTAMLVNVSRLFNTRKNTLSLPVSNSCVFNTRNSCDRTWFYHRYSTNSNENVKRLTKSGGYLLFGTATATAFALYQFFNKSDVEDLEKYLLDAKKVPHNVNKKYPESVDKIPDSVKYVIIGGGTSAFSASRTIKSNDPKAQILMLTNELDYPYMRPPLSKELFKTESRTDVENLEFIQWSGSLRSIFFENDEFYTPCDKLSNSENGGIAVARGWVVSSVDADSKTVLLKDGKQIKYDKCLIATGSVPLKLPFLDNETENIKEKITYYHSLSDFKLLNGLITSGPKSIAIYGSGLLGCELACSLSKRGLGVKIVQIIEGSNVMEDLLPTYLCNWLTHKCEEDGITVVKQSNIKNILINDNQLHIIFSNDSKIVVDHLLVCLGAKPNTEIAKASGLEVDSINGGFLVNSELLARTDLYAAGDCASYYDLTTGQRQVITHYDHAIASGQVAGENMIGASKSYIHHAGFWSEFCSKVGFEAVGNISSELKTIGFFASQDTDNPKVTLVNNPASLGNSKGIIFYLNKDQVVEGVVLWNLFNQLPVARQVIASRKPYEDLTEVLKHFDLFVEDEI